jgi:hypothetical protein
VYQERAKATQPPQVPAQSGAGRGVPSTSGQSTPEPTFNGPPPAMSEAAFKKVLGETPPSPEDIEKVLQSQIRGRLKVTFLKKSILDNYKIAKYCIR